MMKSILALVSFLLLAAKLSVVGAELPKVLLLGDSISIGYTPLVVEGMKDKAAVSRPTANCGNTQAGRFVGDDVKYNETAVRVMMKHGVRINDLHALTKALDVELFVGPGNVHFTKEGSQKLASQVMASIDSALKK